MNLFNFNYQEQSINNQDGSPSRFGVVYGQSGQVVHVKKDSYHVISTEAFSQIGNAFKEQGFPVSSFVHRHGEVIGLNIGLGQRPSKVGDKTYNAYINLPNNGGGAGKLIIHEVRLVCTNGAVRTLTKGNSVIKIPHNITYPIALQLMQKSLQEFVRIIEYVEQTDLLMDDQKITKTDLMFHLNKWYYEQEMPDNHKKDLSFNQFRELLYTDPSSIESIHRYRELMAALDREIQHNSTLKLDLSVYTLYATITDYLTRRQEKSNSAAPQEIQLIRQAEKLSYMNQFVTAENTVEVLV